MRNPHSGSSYSCSNQCSVSFSSSGWSSSNNGCSSRNHDGGCSSSNKCSSSVSSSLIVPHGGAPCGTIVRDDCSSHGSGGLMCQESPGAPPAPATRRHSARRRGSAVARGSRSRHEACTAARRVQTRTLRGSGRSRSVHGCTVKAAVAAAAAAAADKKRRGGPSDPAALPLDEAQPRNESTETLLRPRRRGAERGGGARAPGRLWRRRCRWPGAGECE